MKDYGVAGLVRSATWLDAVCGMEVLSIGRSACGPEECGMEVAGTQLLVRIRLQGGWLWLSACGLDEGGGPQPVCNFPDTPQGWCDVRRFIQALERSGVKSLQPRPIHIGGTCGPDSYTID